LPKTWKRFSQTAGRSFAGKKGRAQAGKEKEKDAAMKEVKKTGGPGDGDQWPGGIPGRGSCGLQHGQIKRI